MVRGHVFAALSRPITPRCASCQRVCLPSHARAKPHWFYSMMEMKWLKNYILQVHYDAIDKAVSMPEAQAVRSPPSPPERARS